AAVLALRWIGPLTSSLRNVIRDAMIGHCRVQVRRVGAGRRKAMQSFVWQPRRPANIARTNNNMRGRCAEGSGGCQAGLSEGGDVQVRPRPCVSLRRAIGLEVEWG